MARRRGSNEGSIFRDRDRWRAQITLPNGKRRSRSFRTRADAARWLAIINSKLHRGVPALPEQMTVKGFLERWLADAIAHRVGPRTSAAYESVVRVHLVPTLGELRLHQLRPDHVQSLLSEKIDSGLSNRSVELIHAILKRGLKQAVRWGLIARNVAELVDPPRARRREMTVLTPDQVKLFLESVRERRLYALYVLAVSTGMRQGELLALRWDDVDLEARRLRVTATLTVTKGALVRSEPKTSGSRRTITISPLAVAALREHRKRQIEERLLAGGNWDHEDTVFVTRRGTWYHCSNITHYFQDALKRAGLPRIRFHDLRHTAATLLLSEGTHPKIVSDMLGHSQIALTLDTYSHVLPNMQQEAADTMQRILSGRSATSEG